MPGGPHIGAPSTLLSAFTGNVNPQLNMLLSMEERLIFIRNLGSGPWIMPYSMPENALPCIFLRREGALEVTMKGMIGDCDVLVRNQYGTRDIQKARLCVKYGEEEAVSRMTKCRTNGGDSKYFQFEETFVFSTPPCTPSFLEDFERTIKLKLVERGNERATEREAQPQQLDASRGSISGTMGYVRKCFGGIGTTEFAVSKREPIDFEKLMASEGCEMDMTVKIHARADTVLFSKEVLPNSRNIDVVVHLKWIPPSAKRSDAPSTNLANIPHNPIYPIYLTSSDGKRHEYDPVCGEEILRQGMGHTIFEHTKKYFDDDPLGPRFGCSAEKAPPVKRVLAVYGINVPTQVSGTLCRPRAMVVKKGKVRARFVPDPTGKSAVDREYGVYSGGIWETTETPQLDLVTGKTIRRSGDDTVPYWSLQVPKTWKSETRAVRVEELEGAGHRGILNDERFHAILLDYLGGKDAVHACNSEAESVLQNGYRPSLEKKPMEKENICRVSGARFLSQERRVIATVYEARNLGAVNGTFSSFNPYAKVYYDGEIKGKTLEQKYGTINPIWGAGEGECFSFIVENASKGPSHIECEVVDKSLFSSTSFGTAKIPFTTRFDSKDIRWHSLTKKVAGQDSSHEVDAGEIKIGMEIKNV